jgi:DNA-binding Lrp family transcriptional regulator
VHLTKLQKQLCNALQEGLPICPKPYDDLAKYLNNNEETILQETKELKESGVIRRICALINYRALGLTGTLVAAHIPQENLQQVIEAVNSLENVSHNYLREHYYNLWFTLQDKSREQIEVTLSNLSGRFGIDFYSLPVECVFKLDARFDAEGEGQLAGAEPSAAQLAGDIEQVPNSKMVELNKTEKQILSKLEDDLDVISEPFDFLCSEGLETDEVLRMIQGLIDKGVIRRIAAIVDHRKLGFVANVLFCSKVPADKIIEAGKALARFGMVTHCYQRKPVEDWPYNLYAMMHGRSMGEIQHLINRFTEAQRIDLFELLPTAAELKKQPVKHRFD